MLGSRSEERDIGVRDGIVLTRLDCVVEGNLVQFYLLSSIRKVRKKVAWLNGMRTAGSRMTGKRAYR